MESTQFGKSNILENATDKEQCKSILQELTNQHYETVQTLYSASQKLTKCVDNLGSGAVNYLDGYPIEHRGNHISVYVSLIDATNSLLGVIMTNLTRLEQFTDK